MPIVPTWLSNEDFVKYIQEYSPVKGAWTQLIHKALNDGLSSKGRTSGFGPDNVGSSPTEPAKIIKQPKEVGAVIVGMGFKPCKHGADPQFCRHSRQGKLCK